MANPRAAPWLAPLLVEVQATLGAALDLSSLARRSGLSPYHFHRVFREHTGETPRQHIERLRLERAFLRLAASEESIPDVYQAVGFARHETFARAFKRRYGMTPSELRLAAQCQHAELRGQRSSVGTRCQLSSVRFAVLPRAVLLAKRRVGAYDSFDYEPLTRSDRLWNPLLRWVTRHRVRHELPAWGLSHDLPGITPPSAQRFDACLRIERMVPDAGELHCLQFAGGSHGVIEHVGPPDTVPQAFRVLADAIHSSPRFAFRDGPAVTLYRKVRVNGDPQLHHIAVYLPVAQRQRKKRQSASGTRR